MKMIFNMKALFNGLLNEPVACGLVVNGVLEFNHLSGILKYSTLHTANASNPVIFHILRVLSLW